MFKDLFLSISLLCGFAMLVIALHHMQLNVEVNLLVTVAAVTWSHLLVVENRYFVLGCCAFVAGIMINFGLIYELIWLFAGIAIAVCGAYISKEPERLYMNAKALKNQLISHKFKV